MFRHIVIASEAKQSPSFQCVKDCFVTVFLAMTVFSGKLFRWNDKLLLPARNSEETLKSVEINDRNIKNIRPEVS